MKNTNYILTILLILLAGGGLYAQNSEYRNHTTESKLGFEVNIPISKNGKHTLSPSTRIVFSDHNTKDKIYSYEGFEGEILYSYSVLKYLTLMADLEFDVAEGGYTYLSFFIAARPYYKINRFNFYTEFRLSTNRRLAYHEGSRSPHSTYIAGIAVDLIPKVMTLNAKCNIPHNLKTNAVEKIKIKGLLNIALSSHIGFNVSYEWIPELSGDGSTHIPMFGVAYSL